MLAQVSATLLVGVVMIASVAVLPFAQDDSHINMAQAETFHPPRLVEYGGDGIVDGWLAKVPAGTTIHHDTTTYTATKTAYILLPCDPHNGMSVTRNTYTIYEKQSLRCPGQPDTGSGPDQDDLSGETGDGWSCGDTAKEAEGWTVDANEEDGYVEACVRWPDYMSCRGDHLAEDGTDCATD